MTNPVPEVERRCIASRSGNCLQMVEGFGHCADDECEMEPLHRDLGGKRFVTPFGPVRRPRKALDSDEAKS